MDQVSQGRLNKESLGVQEHPAPSSQRSPSPSLTHIFLKLNAKLKAQLPELIGSYRYISVKRTGKEKGEGGHERRKKRKKRSERARVPLTILLSEDLEKVLLVHIDSWHAGR